MKLQNILTEAELKRDVVAIEARLNANAALVQLLGRINTTDELAQTLSTIISLVDKTASFNISKVLLTVRDQLKTLKAEKGAPKAPKEDWPYEQGASPARY